MSARKDGGPAWPQQRTEYGLSGKVFSHQNFPGMTLRDWFAGQALAGVIERCHSDAGAIEAVRIQGTPVHFFASVAYQMADAMIAERDK